MQQVRTQSVKEAEFAACTTHAVYIDRGLYWGLSQSIALHKTGIGSEAYCKVRNMRYQPCKIILWKFEEAS